MKENWIKVTDKLPENEYYVLVYDVTGDYDLAWYSQIRKNGIGTHLINVSIK